jgi:putative redox protein
MPAALSIHAIHHGGMRVTATTRDFALTMDHSLEPGEKAAGLQPLEALLASLAGCSLNTLALLLRRAEQPVRGLAVTAHGVRHDGHASVLKDISLEFVVRGRAVDAEKVERALLATAQYMSPVWAMLKDGPGITSSFRIDET